MSPKDFRSLEDFGSLFTPEARIMRTAILLLVCFSCWLLTQRASAADAKPEEKMREVAGSAEFLRSVPKHFATLKGMDRAKHRVTLLMEGETEPREWPLAPDAELKIAGWWGRLDQFSIGDRVWVWLQLDRVKQPIAVSMLADEISEQDIHGSGVELTGREGKCINLKGRPKLDVDGAEIFRAKEKEKLDNL